MGEMKESVFKCRERKMAKFGKAYLDKHGQADRQHHVLPQGEQERRRPVSRWVGGRAGGWVCGQAGEWSIKTEE